MELPSAPAQRGAVPWLGLLLTALLFTFWSTPTTAEYSIIPVELVPPNAIEGKEVLLFAHLLPEKYFRLEWYNEEYLPFNSIATLRPQEGKLIKGPLYSRRYTLNSNGSLLIRNLKKADAGDYKILLVTLNGTFVYGKVKLPVYDPVAMPEILVSYTKVVLTCFTNQTGISIRWYLNDKDLQPIETRKLSSDNRTLTLSPVSQADEGDYQCEVFNPASSVRSAHIKLKVTAKGPESSLPITLLLGPQARGAVVGKTAGSGEHIGCQYSNYRPSSYKANTLPQCYPSYPASTAPGAVITSAKPSSS